MKRIYLVRHAKSSWKHIGLSDHDRPLNERGERDAPRMGRRLQKSGARPDLLLSSPARRAISTARIIAEELGYPPERIVEEPMIYDGSAREIFELFKKLPAQVDSVMLFGHNLEITILAEYLTPNPIGNLPTCGVFCADFAVESWPKIAENAGQLVFFDYPKNPAHPKEG